MTINLHDVIAANQLLMSMGGDDQIPKIAASAIERQLELQNRIDRALTYASQTPPNSAHARQMARILDGSITIDDELNEVKEQHPLPQNQPRRLSAVPAAKKKAGPRGKLKAGAGLTGRSTAERLEMRKWIAENGFDISPTGRIPQNIIDAYDETQSQMRRMRQEVPGQMSI
jgi:hypothetical protein